MTTRPNPPPLFQQSCQVNDGPQSPGSADVGMQMMSQSNGPVLLKGSFGNYSSARAFDLYY